MKNIVLLLLCIFLFACSNDDDSKRATANRYEKDILGTWIPLKDDGQPSKYGVIYKFNSNKTASIQYIKSFENNIYTISHIDEIENYLIEYVEENSIGANYYSKCYLLQYQYYNQAMGKFYNEISIIDYLKGDSLALFSEGVVDSYRKVTDIKIKE